MERQPNPQAIKELASGKRKVASASWWGFSPAGSTAALQAAINSGAKKLIVENMGAPWIVDKLQLARATQRLREYIVKGFTLDDERLKQGGSGNEYYDELLHLEKERLACHTQKWYK